MCDEILTKTLSGKELVGNALLFLKNFFKLKKKFFFIGV